MRRDVIGDGVKIVATPRVRKSVWFVAGAMALAALAVLLLLRITATRDANVDTAIAEPPPPAGAALAVPAPERERETKPIPSRHARRITSPDAPAPPPDSEVAGAAEPPSREDVPFSLGKPGDTSGIKLFPAMGTKPTKAGIVVPDDFDLPEGYVRHFQATEDGQLLPAILLFHPDYEWVDDAGDPIALPADRVVPPELAPPGLPIQMLDVRGEPGGAR